MTRQKAVLFLAALATAIAAVTTFALLPKRYRISEHLTRTTALWNDKEAFLFLSINTEGRATNILQEKLTATRHGYFALLMGIDSFRFKQSAIAYHLLFSGTLDRFELPEGTGVYGSWSLRDGALQFTPSGNPHSHIGDSALPLRWDGERFIILPSTATEPKASGSADKDLAAGDPHDAYNSEGLSAEEEQLQKAGWHRKTLAWNKSKAGELALPINLGRSTFSLVLRGLPSPKDFVSFDSLGIEPRDLLLSGSVFAQAKELWRQGGWREVSKTEFHRLPSIRQQMHRTSVSWGWLVALAALLLWRWGHWVWTLFQFATMKKGTFSKMPTAYSLPPASPAQFPFLDSATLNRYTAEFESMGFTRLLDFSLVGNTSRHIPNFCRLLVHAGHHCFAEMFQFFPPGGMPRPLKCSIQGCLQDGWDIDFTDGRPKAESSFFQSRKAIRVNMPEASTSDLLREFLKMREQVCLDLSISPERDDTLEGYIRKVQRAAGEMREAVKRRNFAVGLSQVYFRKLSLLKAREEYVWLGDYPKEAERRKQGYITATQSGLTSG